MNETPTNPGSEIKIPEFCYRHAHEIVHSAKFKPDDQWQALLIISNVAMFQGASATPSVWKKIDGDASRFTGLGCLACCLPFKYRAVLTHIRRPQTKDDLLTGLKQLGMKWVERGSDA